MTKNPFRRSKNGHRWISWDITAGLISTWTGYVIKPCEAFESMPISFHALGIIFSIILGFSGRIIEIPRPGFDFHISRYEIISSSLISVFLSILILSFISVLLFFSFYDRYALIYIAASSFILISFPRIILTEVSNKNSMKILLYGDKLLCETFAKKLELSPYFKVTTIISLENKSNCKNSSKGLNDIDLSSIDCVVICSRQSSIKDQDDMAVMLRLPFTRIEFLTQEVFLEKYLRRAMVDYTSISSLASFSSLPMDSTTFFTKRIMDICVSIVGIIVTLPFLPLVALIIKIDSRGPVFYSQKRVGLNGKNFTIYKFRTMINEHKKNSASWALENDPRITRVGKILRRLRIDELPQLVNVLRKEMSLVGPRPEVDEFEKKLIQKFPLYIRRHLTMPGITGWAQIKYKYGSSFEDSKIKLEYDLYYIRHMSLILDIQILIKTFIMFMRGSR